MKKFITTFHAKTYIQNHIGQLIFGEHVALETGKKFAEMGIKGVVVIYDQGIAKIGLAEPIIDSILAEGIEVVRFDRVVADPPEYIVEEATVLSREAQIDGVLAVGGGSTMDTAKVIALYREAEGSLIDYMNQARFFKKPASVKLIAIPTTAGTGAELTAAGVITDSKTGLKAVCIAAAPDVILLDPCLTVGLPPYITYTTAMDALSHAIERITSCSGNPRADMLCGQTVEYVWRSLPKVLANGKDMEARGELLLGANFTLDFTQGGASHLGHGAAHAIGAVYHIAHGHLLALELPAVVRYVASTGEAERELALIAKKMELDVHNGNYGFAVAQAIEDRNKAFGLKTLREMGIDRKELSACIPNIMLDKRTMDAAPGAPTVDDIEKILDQIYG